MEKPQGIWYDSPLISNRFSSSRGKNAAKIWAKKNW